MRPIRLRLQLALAALVLTACGTAPRPASTPPAEPAPAASPRASEAVAFAWLEGRWQWEGAGCDSAYTMHATHGGKYIEMTYTDGGQRDTSVYRVLAHGPQVVRGQIEGEKRMDDEGNPVVWDFVQLSQGEFCWHRADWGNDSCTRTLLRCGSLSPAQQSRATLPRTTPLAGRRPHAG
jgi:hypothetical protein